MMRSRGHENTLVSLLRACYAKPVCRPRINNGPIGPGEGARLFDSRPRFSSHLASERLTFPNISVRPGKCEAPLDPSRSLFKAAASALANSSPAQYSQPENVAILGGGITGLTAAYWLSRELPEAKITLYEASERLGGWLSTKHVDVGNGHIIFEQGPRTLRPGMPNGLLTLKLIKQLGLEDELLITTKDSVAAQNRYLYYPDRLVRMPGPGAELATQLWTVLTEPIFKGLFTGIWGERSVPQRPDDLEDESLGSFFARRLGSPNLVDNILSGVIHGIYAGDVYQLSAKSLQPTAWRMEGKSGSLTNALWERRRPNNQNVMAYRDAALCQELVNESDQLARHSEMTFASVFSFKRGIGQLSDTMVQSLQDNPNVTVRCGARVDTVEYDGERDGMKVVIGKESIGYDHVISTISGRHLSKMTNTNAQLPSLAATHGVTVMVVNLYYRDPNIKSVRGFGYLIPRSIPYEQNPEMALGVVFDSDASIGQDSAEGTKLTVMMGGHWWDGAEAYPDEEEGAAMAARVVKRHLGIQAEPEFVHVSLQKECIPQYTVGHSGRMRKAHQELMTAFKGKLAVAGNSYTGVGLNDCVRAARDVVLDVAQYEGPRGGGITGLEQFTVETQWVNMSMGVKG